MILLQACFTQEHLIFFRNLNHVSLFSIDQLLKESGLKINKSEGQKKTETNIVVNKPVITETAVKKIAEIHKQLQIPENNDFSINLPQNNNFVVLKSIQGDTKYLKDNSRQDKGFFLFHSGKTDSKIQFQIINVDGNMQTNIYYYIQLQTVQKQSISSSSVVELSTNQASSAPETQPQMEQGTNQSIFPSMVITSTEGLSQESAAGEYRKMLNSANVTPEEKEKIRYKLIDTLIGMKSLTEAQSQIDQVIQPAKKLYYTAKIQQRQLNNKESLRNYLNILTGTAVPGDESTIKDTLLGLEDLILGMNSIDKSLLDTIISRTKIYNSDKKFFGTSMINIARIYQFVPDAYAAKDIFESIINGDYDAGIKDSAGKYYKELKNDILDYK